MWDADWDADGNEQLVPVLDNGSWVAWDAINRSKLAGKRLGVQIDEGRVVSGRAFVW